jgi:hypothetical protein
MLSIVIAKNVERAILVFRNECHPHFNNLRHVPLLVARASSQHQELYLSVPRPTEGNVTAISTRVLYVKRRSTGHSRCFPYLDTCRTKHDQTIVQINKFVQRAFAWTWSQKGLSIRLRHGLTFSVYDGIRTPRRAITERALGHSVRTRTTPRKRIIGSRRIGLCDAHRTVIRKSIWLRAVF